MGLQRNSVSAGEQKEFLQPKEPCRNVQHFHGEREQSYKAICPHECN